MTLADDFTDLAGLRAALRDSVGHPDQTVLLPDRSVDNAIAEAMAIFTADFPDIAVGTFTTVADQQAYTPAPAGAIGLLRVFWDRRCACAGEFPEYYALLGQIDPFLSPVDEAGFRAPLEPALVMGALRERDWLKKLSRKGVKILNDLQVYLDPVPTSAVEVVFTYSVTRYSDVLDVANDDRRVLLNLVKALLHERLAVGAGAVTHVGDTNEGTAITTAAPRIHEAQAMRFRRMYSLAKPPLLSNGIA